MDLRYARSTLPSPFIPNPVTPPHTSCKVAPGRTGARELKYSPLTLRTAAGGDAERRDRPLHRLLSALALAVRIHPLVRVALTLLAA